MASSAFPDKLQLRVLRPGGQIPYNIVHVRCGLARFKPAAITYNAASVHAASVGWQREPCGLFSVRQQGLQPNVSTYTAVINACGKG